MSDDAQRRRPVAEARYCRSSANCSSEQTAARRRALRQSRTGRQWRPAALLVVAVQPLIIRSAAKTAEAARDMRATTTTPTMSHVLLVMSSTPPCAAAAAAENDAGADEDRR